MSSRKLDVSTGAGGRVAVARTRFDAHLSGCEACQRHGLCFMAQSLWRSVCMAALKDHGAQS